MPDHRSPPGCRRRNLLLAGIVPAGWLLVSFAVVADHLRGAGVSRESAG